MANVGIDPSVLVAPDYQTQMMQAQRRLALAQSLQQQAMTDTPGNGGSVSWTQGLARALEGWSSAANAKRGYEGMKGANQGYARGMWQMFHPGQPYPGDAQTAQGAPPPQSGTPAPPMPQNAPQGPLPTDPSGIPQASPAISAAAQGQPVAPPQAASPPPSAPPPSAPTGGAPNPMSLTGNGDQDMATYMMAGPEEYGKALIAAHAPTDFAKLLSQSGIDPNSELGRQFMQQQIAKQNYQAPASARPGGWTQDPQTGQWMFHPQAPIPGAVPGKPDTNGNMTWVIPQGTEEAVAARAKSQAGGTAAGTAPYQFKEVYNAETGQMELVPVSSLAGSPASPGKYTPGAGGSTTGSPSGPAAPGGHAPAGPPLGLPQAQGELGKGYAQQFNDDQAMAKEVPQQRQSLYNMWNLVKSGTAVGPTAHKFQEFAKEWGITPLANSNLFVFDKNSSRFIAQSAKAVGLNGSDTRLGLMASASPTSQMDAPALNKVIPEVIGLTNAVAAHADAKAYWVQHHPEGVMGSPQFEAWWRQNYDPRIFTMMAFGPDAFKAAINKLPAQARQTYMNKYYALRDMGVDYSQFAQ